jgi:disulfide bond formation protein DsbB
LVLSFQEQLFWEKAKYPRFQTSFGIIAAPARLRHSGRMIDQRTRMTGILVAVAAFAALGIAYFAEFHLRMVPCPLCLIERWPYRIAAAIGLLAAMTPRSASRFLLALAILVLLGGAAIAFIHVGVEQGWWPSPLPECNAPPPSFGALPLRPSVSCSSPVFLIPGLPVSMALMDMIYALVFAAFILIYLRQSRRRAS